MRFISKTKRTSYEVRFVLEVTIGFEPMDNGVADRGLTTWLRHLITVAPFRLDYINNESFSVKVAALSVSRCLYSIQ